MSDMLTQELLGKHAFDALNMVFDESVRVVENFTAVLPKVVDGRIVTAALTGPVNYRVVMRTNPAGGLALASGVFDCRKSDVKPSMIDDAMFELIKMVAGQIRNSIAREDQLSDPSALADDAPLTTQRVLVGSRLCLGNDESQVDVLITEDAAITSIAVAQSDDAALAAVKTAVQSAGMRVVSEAVDGLKALQEIRQLRPDVVCLDFSVSNMTGLDVFAAIRSEMPGAIVFLVSATATAENVRLALKFRPNGIVVRPFENTRLVADINRALERRPKK